MNRFHLRILTAIACIAMLVPAAFAQSNNVIEPPPSAPPNTIPAGTELQVRINDYISSEKAQPGDRFTGSLVVPVYINNSFSYPQGSMVEGRIIAIKDSGHLSNPGEMELVVESIRINDTSSVLNVNTVIVRGGSHTGSNVGKIGGGAALGAIIGAAVGGGKGAAIGAGAGAGAGTATAAATGKKPAIVDTETVLRFTLNTDALVNNIPYGANMAPAPARDDQNGPNGPALERRTRSEGERQESMRGFSARMRQDIQNCFVDNADDIPSSYTMGDRMAPSNGYNRGDVLTDDQMSRSRQFPQVCSGAVQGLPENRQVVVANGQVLLLNSSNRVLDVFSLNTSN